jgi:hypothetical protein
VPYHERRAVSPDGKEGKVADAKEKVPSEVHP